MPRSNRVFARIAAASDKEQLEDYLAEVRYALIFCGLGFEVTIEPGGNKGPDLSISRDGHSAVVEIMRFRKVYSGSLRQALLTKTFSCSNMAIQDEILGRLSRRY